MAEVSIPSAEVLLSKRVQEMVLNGQDPLGPYVCRNKHDNVEEESPENSPIPIIDLGCFLPQQSSTEETEENLEKLKSALSTWGCFRAIGHGIPSSFLDEVRQVGREFFQQPMEEKNKYAKPVTVFEGYGADPVPEEGQSLDWSDRLFLELVPEDRRNYRLWPRNPTSFKKTLEEYTEKMKSVTEIISKSMAKSLHLEENCFLKQFGERAQLQGRFNYYTPCKRPDLVLGLKAHADGSGYTILMHDEPGLQILKDGKWYTAPKNPDVLLVLMGDQMEIMSNGIFKSPVHRVVSDSKSDRISVAMFYTPEVGKEIGPQEGLISEEVPRAYKTVKDYADFHLGYYQKGMRSIHAVKV
ncbi:Iron/ascorbate family oxidoreductase [Handroanthus impetiginosus]|uniref:Iron/ascorbate family oxidoreductase n=1 Tax=Handroanthus impetiginosus TaxID=429701 RepID=A0A2G9HA10_9LAMI|nr:Iron/ascorbate family oxidoreductase [Handroanthus impetiginosus]